MSDTTAIDRWLEAYRRAWQTDLRDDIERLFTDDVRYYTAPYAEPLEGREEVAAYWLGEEESAIAWTFEAQVLAREGGLNVVRAVTTYPGGTKGAGTAEVFHNLWLVTLASDGRASEFVEYYMLAR